VKSTSFAWETSLCSNSSESFGDIGSETEFIRSGYSKLRAFWNIWYLICMISMYRYVQYTFQCNRHALRIGSDEKFRDRFRSNDRGTNQWPRSNDRASRWLWRLWHWLYAMEICGELVSQLRATYFSLRLGRNS
jgi:hypothetical protein